MPPRGPDVQLKGVALARLQSGTIPKAELHWYEAHGIGQKEVKRKRYRVVPDQDAAREGDVRVVDESGEDYLYPAKWFVPAEVPRRVRTSLLRTA